MYHYLKIEAIAERLLRQFVEATEIPYESVCDDVRHSFGNKSGEEQHEIVSEVLEAARDLDKMNDFVLQLFR